jgi:hypothetical protein
MGGRRVEGAGGADRLRAVIDRNGISMRSPGLALAAAATLAAALLVFALNGASARAAAESGSCPPFRVLHNDRIGAASLPAGTYAVTVSPSSGLSCKDTTTLFARFLEDYDGNLPNGWMVKAEGSGKASFTQGRGGGFSVSRTGGSEEGGNPLIGALCPNTFTVNARATAAGLVFPAGKYLIYRPAGSGITCNRAAVLFNRFLAQRGGRLPFPWLLKNQTATFYKPEHPARSSFRVEPFSGT